MSQPFKTQFEIFKALIAGEKIKSLAFRSILYFHMVNGQLVDDQNRVVIESFTKPEEWSIYEESKPKPKKHVWQERYQYQPGHSFGAGGLLLTDWSIYEEPKPNPKKQVWQWRYQYQPGRSFVVGNLLLTEDEAAKEYKGEFVVNLATAHPAKFPDAVIEAGAPKPELPLFLQDLPSKKEKYEILENDLQTVKDFISTKI